MKIWWILIRHLTKKVVQGQCTQLFFFFFCIFGIFPFLQIFFLPRKIGTQQGLNKRGMRRDENLVLQSLCVHSLIIILGNICHISRACQLIVWTYSLWSCFCLHVESETWVWSKQNYVGTGREFLSDQKDTPAAACIFIKPCLLQAFNGKISHVDTNL